MQRNGKLTAAHMNYKVSRRLIFKPHKRLPEVRESRGCKGTAQQHEKKFCQMFSNTFNYRKNPKYSDTQNICCNHPKICTRWLYQRVMHPKDAAGIANSVGAVWSRSVLFAQAYLSENLGSLRLRQ